VLTGTAAVLAASSAAPAFAQTPTAPRNFALVSAAWYGGWCWARVADRLRARGHRVYAPTLTGLGERSHLLRPDVNLDTHIADVVNLIRWEELTNVTLVGHSYGGIVVSGVAEKALPALASLIFVDAFLPANGEALIDTASPLFHDAMEAAVKKKETALTPVKAEVFGVNAKDRAWVDGKTTPHPLATFTQKIALTGAREKVGRKAFIRASDYRQDTLQRNYESKRSDAAWRTAIVSGTGHMVMLDAPERLAALLEELA
jgi:pimeloyl-ACP methyl ester carboxylesterase